MEKDADIQIHDLILKYEKIYVDLKKDFEHSPIYYQAALGLCDRILQDLERIR